MLGRIRLLFSILFYTKFIISFYNIICSNINLTIISLVSFSVNQALDVSWRFYRRVPYTTAGCPKNSLYFKGRCFLSVSKQESFWNCEDDIFLDARQQFLQGRHFIQSMTIVRGKNSLRKNNPHFFSFFVFFRSHKLHSLPLLWTTIFKNENSKDKIEKFMNYAAKIVTK